MSEEMEHSPLSVVPWYLNNYRTTALPHYRTTALPHYRTTALPQTFNLLT